MNKKVTVMMEKKVTAQDLYDHILKYMTAEEALLKLLTSSLIQYEHLKFKEDGTPVHPIFILSAAALDMGWGMALKKGAPDDEIEGFLVGSEEFLKETIPNIFGQLK